MAQRKKLIRCVCDASGDKAPCCDDHKGRHHSSVEDIMKLAEVTKKGSIRDHKGGLSWRGGLPALSFFLFTKFVGRFQFSRKRGLCSLVTWPHASVFMCRSFVGAM